MKRSVMSGTVETCPANSTEVVEASSRLNCGRDWYGNNQYVCAPNIEKTALVEFCYDGIMRPIPKGNCLEINNRAFVDRNCTGFVEGCPEKYYRGNAVYKHPACLRINTGYKCYLADPSCPNITRQFTTEDSLGSSTAGYTTEKGVYTTPTPPTTAGVVMSTTETNGVHVAAIVGPIIGLVVLVIIGILIGIIVWKRRKKRKERRKKPGDELHEIEKEVLLEVGVKPPPSETHDQPNEDDNVQINQTDAVSEFEQTEDQVKVENEAGNTRIQGASEPSLHLEQSTDEVLNGSDDESDDEEKSDVEEDDVKIILEQRKKERMKRLGDYSVWKTGISDQFSSLSDDEVCVLFCFLCSDSGTPDFTDTYCLAILNEIREVYDKDSVTSEEAQRTLDGLKSRGFLWDEDGVHLSEDVKDETMYRVTRRVTGHATGLYSMYRLSSYTTAVRYLRLRAYTRKSGEKCVFSNDRDCDSLLIRRLQMNILTHVTMEDTRIFDKVSQSLNIPLSRVHANDEERGAFLVELNQTGECVQYRGGSQDSVQHVNWLWRLFLNAKPDIVKSCIGLHPHWDIYIINNTAYRKHSQHHDRPPAERCLLYCLLMVDDYTVKVKDESHIKVYNAIRERYFTDLPVCEDIPAPQNPEAIVHVENDVIKFKSDIRHDVMHAFVTECLVKDSDLKFFLTTASRDVIKEYCRSWDYERSEGERCLYIPDSPDEMFNLFIDRLQLDILTHCTVSDWSIQGRISTRLRVPLEVLSWDKDARERYVKSSKEQGRKKMFYARGMLVGCAGAGKTTLLVKLMNRETTDEEKHTETTVGLDVHEDLFEIEFDTLKDYKGKDSVLQSDKQIISMTDFAGQVVYYACHQVYLSRRAFYLLVVDMSKNLKENAYKHNTDRHDPTGSLFHNWTYLDYLTFWLQCIKTYCDVGERRVRRRETDKEGDSNPVILIASHKDETDRGKEKTNTPDFFWKLRNSLPKGFACLNLLSSDRYFEVECPPTTLNDQQRDAIESVKRCIVKIVTKLPHWGEEIPLNWITFMEMLNKKKEEGVRILKRDALREMEYLKVLPEEDLDDMLRFFKDIGHILYFADKKLRDTIIINVQWFVNAFKYIITDRKHLPVEVTDCDEWMRTGRIPESAFQKIWEESGNDAYIQHQSDILPYMQKLGLMTQKLKNSETYESMYYVPSMNRVDFYPGFLDVINRGHKTSILIFHFKTYLPHFFFFRLVAHCSATWEELDPIMFSKNAAFYKTRAYSHCIAIAVNTTSILLQVFTPGKDTNLQTEEVVGIRSEVENCVENITQTFHEQVEYEIGYSCENVPITDVEERHFLLEDKVLKFGDIITCPNHFLGERSHDINKRALIGFWRSDVRI